MIMIYVDLISKDLLITTKRYTLASALKNNEQWKWLLRNRQGKEIKLTDNDIDEILDTAMKEFFDGAI